MHRAPNIACEMIERIDLILGTLETECAWEAFYKVKYLHIVLYNDDNGVV